MESVEVSAKTVDEAIDIALEDLGLKRSQVDIEVLTPGKPGLGRATAVLDVEGDDLGLLIGRRGTTLAALQYFVNVLVTRKLGSRVLVTVDVEHYHRRREETLQGLARRMADRVRQSRRPITLEPMPAGERRIIHIALADDHSVVTASTGYGDGRKVVIKPRGNGRQSGRPPGRGPGPRAGRFQGPRI